MPALPRILIFAGFFPPDNRTAARRPYYMARHFADRGHDVTVVTREASSNDWTPVMDGIRTIRFPISRRTPGLGPAGRVLERAHWWLMDRGHVRIARTLADLLLPLDVWSRPDMDPRRIGQMVPPPDIVLATGGPWSNFEHGHHASRHWGCAYVVDYRDPWTLVHPEVGLSAVTYRGRGITGAWRRVRAARLERRYTADARAVVAVTPQVLANARAVIGPKPGLVVYNGHAPAGPSQPPRRAGGKLVLVYTGTVYLEQEWMLLDTALKQLRHRRPTVYEGIELRLIGATSRVPADRQAVERIVHGHTCVRAIPAMARDQALAAQRSADLLLHIGFKGKDGILPLKFMEYLHADRPIMHVGTGNDLQCALLQRTATGAVLSTPEAVVRHLEEAHRHHVAGRAQPYAPDRQALQEFTWSAQMERLRLVFLDLVMGRALPTTPR
ncbi:MAG: glycosyltransferase [Flavobacteriales bacterium]|nr:glycosyltransferase [Flavobacteriales bacterium]